MLRELKITNLALIESLHLFFGRQIESGTASLVVLTGETGAGKSIILQALNLLSGCKASNTWIRSGAESASVEALFDIPPGQQSLQAELLAKGFSVEECLILKRIISSQGRSRYFINDSLATGALMEHVCESLFSVASQHEHQILLNPRKHLDFIDSVGELWDQRQAFGKQFAQWLDLREQQQKLQQMERDREQQRDLLQFQLKEIQDSAIRNGEDEELGAEKKILRAADMLMEQGSQSYEILSETVIGNLDLVRKNVEQMAQYDQAVSAIAAGIASCTYELDELVRQLNRYLQNIPRDAIRLEEVEARIDLLQKLKRKYGGSQSSLDEIITYADQAAEELAALDTMDQRLADMGQELVILEKDLLAGAEVLSKARRKTAVQLEKAISQELNTLSFSRAEFKAEFAPFAKNLHDLTQSGGDRVEFLFSGNPGEPVKPLAKIASGGELSRLLLGLKCILARRDEVGTVIFDEVDAGIGGQAAEDIAHKIKQLASHHQVLCITHLPQIAAKADEHFRVDKVLQNKRTQTEITLLDEDHRVCELARMLAGDSVTRETMAFAKNILMKEKSKRH